MSATDSFESLRRTLFSLAYRMLGSVSGAEDAAASSEAAAVC
jgi:DNA-directed RNA polymerase specialized sigma24 family protein